MKRQIKHMSIGQKFQAKEYYYSGPDGKLASKMKSWIVTEIYPYIIRARSKSKGKYETRCFNLGELVQLGLEPKGGAAF